jgi:flagellar hook-associated protein 3 FlgL
LITDAAERLTEFSTDVTRAHGVIGARAQAMRARLDQTESTVNATRSFLSEIEDLDYTEAVRRFQQAQTALQASLLSGSQLLNVSLLNFLA